VYVLVDHECGTLRIVGDTLANLPNGPKFAKEIEQLICCYVVANGIKSAILRSICGCHNARARDGCSRRGEMRVG
jgi:hypothetical protein